MSHLPIVPAFRNAIFFRTLISHHKNQLFSDVFRAVTCAAGDTPSTESFHRPISKSFLIGLRPTTEVSSWEERKIVALQRKKKKLTFNSFVLPSVRLFVLRLPSRPDLFFHPEREREFRVFRVRVVFGLEDLLFSRVSSLRFSSLRGRLRVLRWVLYGERDCLDAVC